MYTITPSGLPAYALGAEPLRIKQRYQPVTVVALHLYHRILHRAARTAGGFELFTQRFQLSQRQRDTFHQGHRFAASPLGFTMHAHHVLGALRLGRFVSSSELSYLGSSDIFWFCLSHDQAAELPQTSESFKGRIWG